MRKYKEATQGQSESVQQLFTRKEAIYSKLSLEPIKFCAQMFIEMLCVNIQNKVCDRSKQPMNMTMAAFATLHVKRSLRDDAKAIRKEPKPFQKKQRQTKNTQQKLGKDCLWRRKDHRDKDSKRNTSNRRKQSLKRTKKTLTRANPGVPREARAKTT